MFDPANYPFLMLLGSFAGFWLSSAVGHRVGKGTWQLKERNREDFKFILGGTLTLLGLLIGFTFSMSIERYNQRKNYEEDEANAIGTEYLRADLLPAADAANVRSLLTNYLAQRMADYRSRDRQQLRQINLETARLQARLWFAVAAPAATQQTPVMALVAAGMNDVLNSQGYTAAAWRNRVPLEAWALLGLISIFCNLMIGFGAQARSPVLLLILPFVLAISLFLIADIDSPRRGLVRVQPLNLQTLANSLRPAPNS